jgi:hypothetical protein
MAVNLMDMVKGALAGQVADQLGPAVGLDKKQAASAVEAVIPVLLGGMMKKASTPSGASELSKVLRDQDTSMLDNLGGLLGGGSSSMSSVIAAGSKLLPMLLGGASSNVLAMLVKMLGINEKTLGNLLGMLAPIVMSVVGKQAKSMGALDPSALTSLLGSQSNFIANAMPAELKGAMGLTDALGAMGNAGKKATTEVAKASNPLQWLLPVLALAALGYLGYTFLFNKPAENPPASNTPSVSMPEIPKVELPDLSDMQKSLMGTMDGLTGTLEGITDEASAKEALGKIESATKAYGELGIDKLPAAAQTAMNTFLQPILKRLTEVLDKVYAIPGVKEIVEPVLGPMVNAVKAIGA